MIKNNLIIFIGHCLVWILNAALLIIYMYISNLIDASNHQSFHSFIMLGIFSITTLTYFLIGTKLDTLGTILKNLLSISSIFVVSTIIWINDFINFSNSGNHKLNIPFLACEIFNLPASAITQIPLMPKIPEILTILLPVIPMIFVLLGMQIKRKRPINTVFTELTRQEKV